MPRSRHERGANELAQCVGDVPKEHLQIIEASRLDQTARHIQIRQVVLREVLNLHQSPRPSPGSTRAVELSETPDARVRTGRAAHGGVFRHRCFSQHLAQFQHPANDDAIGIGREQRNRFAGQTRNVGILILEPLQQLITTVGVIKSGEFDRLGRDPCALVLIALNRRINERRIHADATIHHPLIESPQASLVIRDGQAIQAVSDLALGYHVPRTIGLELQPLRLVVFGAIPCATAVRHRGFTGQAEIADQAPALLELGLHQPQHPTNVGQVPR